MDYTRCAREKARELKLCLFMGLGRKMTAALFQFALKRAETFRFLRLYFGGFASESEAMVHAVARHKNGHQRVPILF